MPVRKRNIRVRLVLVEVLRGAGNAMPAALAVLIAVGFTVLVLASSSVVVSVVAGRLGGLSGMASGISMQVMITVFTLALAFLVVKRPGILGTLSLPLVDLAEGVVLAGLTVSTFYLLWAKLGLISEKCRPPVELRSVWEFMVLAFIAGPTGEELLFRGLVEGYLLSSGTSDNVLVNA